MYFNILYMSLFLMYQHHKSKFGLRKFIVFQFLFYPKLCFHMIKKNQVFEMTQYLEH